MQIVQIPEAQMNIEIMSNGVESWLVITDADGAWIFNREIQPQEKEDLCALGMEFTVDSGMSHPDDIDSY